MGRALTILRFCLGYAGYFLGKVVFVLCATPFLVVLLPFPGLRRRFLHLVLRVYLTFLARVCLPALGIYRIAEITGLEQVRAVHPAIYVANHRGKMDALLTLSLLPPTGVILKSYHLQQLTFALLVWSFDFVSVDPTSLTSVARALARCRSLLGSGMGLLVFPEGRRAPSGRLQPFGATAFQLACEAKLPVVPVILHSTVPFMARLPGSIFPKGKNVFRIRFLTPEQVQPGDTPHRLSDRVHRRMSAELRALDAGTIWERKTASPVA